MFVHMIELRHIFRSAAAAGPRRFPTRSRDERTHHKSRFRFKLLSPSERVYFSHQSGRCSSLQFQLIGLRSVLPWANREHMIVGERGSSPWFMWRPNRTPFTETPQPRPHNSQTSQTRNVPSPEAHQCGRRPLALKCLRSVGSGQKFYVESCSTSWCGLKIISLINYNAKNGFLKLR